MSKLPRNCRDIGVKIARESVGLPPLEVKSRKCLKCDRTFPSKSPGNRICGTCTPREIKTYESPL